ncbi:MAG: response regulator, partial [Pirellulales bacterium]
MSTGSSMRVLIADDNADAATTLALLLKHFGHEAHVVCNGEAGLQQARSLLPDVMFIDLGMPQVDGLSMARQLRQTAEFADTPLVAVSGYVDSEHRALASAAGFDDFLPKPYPMTQLLKTLQRVRARVAVAHQLAETTRLIAEQARDQNQESRRRLDEYRLTRPCGADRQVPVKIEKSGISHVITLPELAAA